MVMRIEISKISYRSRTSLTHHLEAALKNPEKGYAILPIVSNDWLLKWNKFEEKNW